MLGASGASEGSLVADALSAPHQAGLAGQRGQRGLAQRRTAGEVPGSVATAARSVCAKPRQSSDMTSHGEVPARSKLRWGMRRASAPDGCQGETAHRPHQDRVLGARAASERSRSQPHSRPLVKRDLQAGVSRESRRSSALREGCRPQLPQPRGRQSGLAEADAHDQPRRGACQIQVAVGHSPCPYIICLSRPDGS